MSSKQAERVGETVGAKLDELYDRGKEVYEEGRERVRTAGNTVGEYVEQRPLAAVLVAAGAGVLLGMLLSRR